MARVRTVFGPVDLDLRAGITGTVRSAYMTGQCTALAVALSRRGGWPIVALASDDWRIPWDVHDDGVHRLAAVPGHATAGYLADHFDHAVVLTPGGALDVHGLRTLRHVMLTQAGFVPDPDVPAAALCAGEDCDCAPGCVCPQCCLEGSGMVAVQVSESLLLDASRQGGWPVPQLEVADRVAALLLDQVGLGQSRPVRMPVDGTAPAAPPAGSRRVRPGRGIG